MHVSKYKRMYVYMHVGCPQRVEDGVLTSFMSI